MPDATPKSRPFYQINQDYRNEFSDQQQPVPRPAHRKLCATPGDTVTAEEIPSSGGVRPAADLVALFQPHDIASWDQTLELALRLPESRPARRIKQFIIV